MITQRCRGCAVMCRFDPSLNSWIPCDAPKLFQLIFAADQHKPAIAPAPVNNSHRTHQFRRAQRNRNQPPLFHLGLHGLLR